MKGTGKLNKGLDGVTYLRDMVEWLNWRIEERNTDKTPLQLMNEYNEFLESGDEEL